MTRYGVHPSDELLIRAVDGELSWWRLQGIRRHLRSCASCRARTAELAKTLESLVREPELFTPEVPPSDYARDELLARLAALPPQSGIESWRAAVPAMAGFVIVAAALLGVSTWKTATRRPAVSIPNSSLTPGVTVFVDQRNVCSWSAPKNRTVPASLQRQVLEEYGVGRAEARAYEVDYLITPALGGADDIRNLWPQSYSSTVWNARVKDELEDRLRDMVCAGELDLATAQREISSNWIAAYKKYFHTESPIETR
jgi:hypothetical protein